MPNSVSEGSSTVMTNMVIQTISTKHAPYNLFVSSKLCSLYCGLSRLNGKEPELLIK